MVVPTADRSKATVMVKVRFIDKDSRILPEMSAKVAFLSRSASAEEQKPRTALHQTALVNRKDRKVIFLIKGGRVVETPVSLGSPMGDMVEVLEGVKAGDRVVLNPSDGLRNGSKIKIEEK
jgi:multidrug efflux pump subunit AcrA (membrane-fusion protein)